jgi:hypothetical protein
MSNGADSTTVGKTVAPTATIVAPHNISRSMLRRSTSAIDLSLYQTVRWLYETAPPGLADQATFSTRGL